MYVIEGTWEEIERHKAESLGRHLRVTVTSEKPIDRKRKKPAEVKAKPKVLQGNGIVAGLLDSEAYFRQKREETEREDGSIA